MAIRKLMLGSNEAMQHEPSLVEPEPPKPKRKLLGDYPKEERLDQFWKKYADFPDDDAFPKGIDDSKGG
jgi:hypothetical protein|tara:strand:+ start:390 stop:596 length:207 start_codon:yes stop_codon:yes gene_type:complete